ncbi:unnamed protein product [Gongylonema pulchrum]|uniref:Uncharacterized protein n=1 Tax=Gongylonema pulchrum TaxID=637853 RepID=A0A3P6QUN4_9BILA|nr:unnamed protein product [Gongylonema pulchrum]
MDDDISWPEDVKVPKELRIIDAELIVCLVCTPSVWRGKARMKLWCTILKDIAVCLSEEAGDCRIFNRKLLIRFNFVRKFFQACLEMLQDGKSHLVVDDQDVVPLVDAQLTIIRALIETEATTDELASIWHFIFLSHPAALTYITYGSVNHSHSLDEVPIRQGFFFLRD